MWDRNYKQEYPMQYELKDQDIMQKEYLWHQHFYLVVGLKRVLLNKNRKTHKLELIICGWQSTLKPPKSCVTRDEWQVVEEYVENQYITAVREYLDLCRELLQSNKLLENEKLGFSQITWDDYDDKVPNEKKWRQQEMFEEWKGYKKPNLKEFIK